MANYTKTKTVLVAKKEDGTFLFLDCAPGTTTPHYVDNPIDATYIEPGTGFEKIHNAPYYFENSSRMRDWLQGCKMVVMEIRIEATIDE